MSTLNPSYASQSEHPLPVIFGYAAGQGDQAFEVVDPANTRYGFVIAADGECDGPEQLAMFQQPLMTIPQRWGTWPILGVGTYMFPHNTNVHAGRWTTIGLTNALTSTGQDQGFDEFFSAIPTVTPPQSFSNMAYYALKCPAPSAGGPANRGQVTSVQPMTSFSVFRGARCRYFDVNGNVTGYGFTTNPTWHIIEAILRYKIKRQQPQVAGLTAAEKALFDWPSIVAHASRNDAVGTNGLPIYTGNYVFAANATLGSMLELMLRCCRSYILTRNGKIGIYGHDPANSLFSVTSNHVLAGTLQVQKVDLSRSPNVFVPQFRDLDVPAVVAVTSMNTNNAGYTEGARSVPAGVMMSYFQTGGASPFSASQTFFYGDSDNANATGDYGAYGNPDPTIASPEIMGYGPNAAMTANGGYIGTQNSRFKPREPNTVQHRRHQTACGQTAPGVTPLPTVRPVKYDLGNMTYEQADRLMQYERDQLLGCDVPGWQAPRAGSMRLALDAVDVNGNRFDQMAPGEVHGRFTLTEDAHFTYQGEYLITAMQIVAPTASDAGYIEVEFRTYNPNGYSMTSNPPSDSLRTIQSARLPQLGTSQQLSNVAWVLQATPTGLNFTGVAD